MRSDELYLHDIVDAADAIERFLADSAQEAFLLSELQQSAILQKLIVIGEAAARLSEELRLVHNRIPWSDIVAFRNIAVHAYFSVDWAIVWHTATNDVPLLKEQIATIVSSDFDAKE